MEYSSEPIFSVIKALFLFCMFATAFGCTSKQVSGEIREPRCEARSNTEPARLYLNAGADNYGLIEPCESYIEAYINKNTELKSVYIRLEILNGDEKTINDEEIQLELEDKGFGTLRKEIPLNLINGEVCRNLTLRILNVSCKTSTREEMECPNVALITSYSFYDFVIIDETLNVCYTNI